MRAPDPGKLAERYVPSTRRAAEELGLRQEIDLQTSLQRTVDHYRLQESAEPLCHHGSVP